MLGDLANLLALAAAIAGLELAADCWLSLQDD
jgi:hypothetical protein